MTTRREARKQALDVLYEADLLERSLAEVLTAHLEGPESVDAFAAELVGGIDAERGAIDALIREHAHGWSLERMPVVDRNIVRLGVYEILYRDDIPTAVAIDEAVELAKQLSTDDSPRFINGVLAAVARAHQQQAGSEAP